MSKRKVPPLEMLQSRYLRKIGKKFCKTQELEAEWFFLLLTVGNVRNDALREGYIFNNLCNSRAMQKLADAWCQNSTLLGR